MKRNTLTAAVFAGLTGVAGMVSVSHAVNLNPDGLGQVLLYPYYTVRGGNDTLISVVNTTSDAKAVKVRFLEALNSREVLDFNLYLSPFDVWTAALTETSAGGGQMITVDTSCTVPYFVGNASDGVGRQQFLDFQYTGQLPVILGGPGGNNDLGPQGIERTASGYIEMIEMGTLVNDPASVFSDVLGIGAKSAATHDSTGTPADCGALELAWANSQGPWGNGFGNDIDPEDSTARSSGGIFGAASIINVDEGVMFSYNATAIDNFYAGTADAAEQHTSPGSIRPNLNDGDTTSRVFVSQAPDDVDVQTWAFGVEAVNATIMFDNLFNEYTVNPGPGAKTEWVLTFPTKAFHTDNIGGVGFPIGTNAAEPPFTETWIDFVIEEIGSACETFDLDIYDREEQTTQTGLIVSPPPPQQGFELCREVNVIRFSESSGRPDATEILKEPARTSPNLTYTNFQVPFLSGWVDFDLASLGGTLMRRTNPALGTGVRYEGLPVIGFNVNTFTNGATAGGVLSNYGGTFNHRGSRSIVFE